MGKKSIAICISTYKRVSGLENLLKSIEDCQKNSSYDLGVIICDNDSNMSAKPIYWKYKEISNNNYYYACEKERGISYTRNRTIEIANKENYDLISFLDDDEVVDSDWLVNIVSEFENNKDKIIIGKVLPTFDSKPELWIEKGEFFIKEKAPLTANSLMPLAYLKEFKEPLSVKYALTGGSDTQLKFRLIKQGREFVYSDKVIVKEQIPDSRANSSWILQRAFRTGYTASLIELEIFGFKGLIKRISIGVVRFLIFVFTVIPSLFFGKLGLVKSFRNLAKSFGIFYGIIGGKYYEYKTVHGG